MEETAIKVVWAILKKKKSYTYLHVLYLKDRPVEVDVKTARYLKFTGLFEFKK